MDPLGALVLAVPDVHFSLGHDLEPTLLQEGSPLHGRLLDGFPFGQSGSDGSRDRPRPRRPAGIGDDAGS